MADRFYLQNEWADSVTLDGVEAQHLAKVLRKKTGDVVELFDGNGRQANARVESISKREVQLQLQEEPFRSSKIASQITLAVAPPKGDRFRWLIEKTTELGVQRIIPLQTERTVVRPGETKLEKLRQTMISACKQCGRNDFMEILPPTDLSELILSNDIPEMKFFGAIPSLESQSSDPLSQKKSSFVTLFIGPEGGFSEQEISELNNQGAQPVSVSPHVLRVETAAIALVSLLIHSIS